MDDKIKKLEGEIEEL